MNLNFKTVTSKNGARDFVQNRIFTTMIDLKGIIAISGQPGLYKIVAQSKNGIIVEHLSDQKRTHIQASTRVSNLSEVSMFTTTEDKPIESIMCTMFKKTNGGPVIDAKGSDAEIITYFETILPDYDKERVYISNMRKLIQWYNTLHATGQLKLKSEASEASETVSAPIKTEEKFKPKTHTSERVKTTAGVKKTAGVRKTGTA